MIHIPSYLYPHVYFSFIMKPTDFGSYTCTSYNDCNKVSNTIVLKQRKCLVIVVDFNWGRHYFKAQHTLSSFVVFAFDVVSQQQSCRNVKSVSGEGTREGMKDFDKLNASQKAGCIAAS